MTLFRRFLVVQALLFWQGGFLFYAAVVVPLGTDLYGSFEQGRLTRLVTDWLNLIGVAVVAVLAWDQWADRGPRWCRRVRWVLWAILACGLPALAFIHLQIEPYVDSSMDYPDFYLWHRVYLYVASAQWVAGMTYIAVTLRSWGMDAARVQTSRPASGRPSTD